MKAVIEDLEANPGTFDDAMDDATDQYFRTGRVAFPVTNDLRIVTDYTDR